MSALTDLFTSMANKIRSKTGGSDTYTPTEMVSAVDDVYDAGYENATTPITPSNSSPASMTSGTGYKPTANGYAIESYANKTPSDETPVPLSNGAIVKMGGAGYAIENEPTSLTPSDSSPAPISSGGMYRAGGAGYAIENYNTITPSDVPVYVNGGTIHKINGSGANVGCFIDGLAQRTPSDSNPYPVSVGSNYRIINNAGYLYKTNHAIGKYDTEEDVTGANQVLQIETGLPTIRRFFLRCEGNNGGSYHSYVCWTNADLSNYEGGTFSGTGSVSGIYNVKELNNAIHIYCPIIVYVSGGTVTLKTGNNAQCAIKNAWWMACS